VTPIKTTYQMLYTTTYQIRELVSLEIRLEILKSLEKHGSSTGFTETIINSISEDISQ